MKKIGVLTSGGDAPGICQSNGRENVCMPYPGGYEARKQRNLNRILTEKVGRISLYYFVW